MDNFSDLCSWIVRSYSLLWLDGYLKPQHCWVATRNTQSRGFIKKLRKWCGPTDLSWCLWSTQTSSLSSSILILSEYPSIHSSLKCLATFSINVSRLLMPAIPCSTGFSSLVKRYSTEFWFAHASDYFYLESWFSLSHRGYIFVSHAVWTCWAEWLLNRSVKSTLD